MRNAFLKYNFKLHLNMSRKIEAEGETTLYQQACMDFEQSQKGGVVSEVCSLVFSSDRDSIERSIIKIFFGPCKFWIAP